LSLPATPHVPRQNEYALAVFKGEGAKKRRHVSKREDEHLLGIPSGTDAQDENLIKTCQREEFEHGGLKGTLAHCVFPKGEALVDCVRGPGGAN